MLEGIVGDEASGRDLAAKRQEQLRRIVRESHVVGIEELARRLRVSSATIRRDLDHLESLGEIRRVHGGAVALESRLEEPLFDDKTSIAIAEKHRIAEAALTYIAPGDTVYLDGGSTVLALARRLHDRANLTVVTNSLRAAFELAGGGPRLIMIGGELRRLSQTLVGPLTRFLLDRLNVDKAFMGTMGLTINEGLTTTDPGEAYTKELVMERAGRVILLADSSKLDKVSFSRAGRLSSVSTLITDKGMGRKWATQLRKKGVEVLLV